MKLRGIEIGPVIGASGVEGFFREGYPYHRPLKALFPRRFSFSGMAFTAKTTTFDPWPGNMPLKSDRITPRHFKPACIYMNPRSWLKGAALNAVGLSGPGAQFLFESNRWNQLTENFFISFMPVGKTWPERERETRGFIALCHKHFRYIRVDVGIQHNLSCPNVGAHPEELIGDGWKYLDIYQSEGLDVPTVVKINLLARPEVVAEIVKHPWCDAICVSNTLLWGSLPDRIDWKDLFGTDRSPLEKFGGGALSGAPLFPLVLEWLDKANGFIRKPIIAGGGILGPRDMRTLAKLSNVTAASIGSLTMLRPLGLQETIREGHRSIGRRI